MIENEYSQAFTELSVIIDNMENNLKNKIPKELIKAINIGKSQNYYFEYDPQKKLKSQNILPETKSLLSIIYSDYLCSQEEKQKWQEYDRYEEKIIENEKVKKYSNNEIYTNQTKKDGLYEKNVNNELTKLNNSKWYKKIFNKIKEIFIKIF